MKYSKMLIGIIAIVIIAMASYAAYYYLLQKPATPSTGSTLTFAYTAEANSLDPGNRFSTESECVQRFIYDGLVIFDSNMSVLPCLATSWETTNAQNWTFNLRQDVTFTDGTPFNSSCVVFNLSPTNVANITEWASRKGYLPFIASVIEDGPYKVKINCTSPFAPLLPYLAHPAALIVSPSAKLKWGVDFTKNPVGSGPFKLVQWVSGEKIVLAKNENFWGGVPKLDEVIYLPVPETTTRVAMLKTGQADVIHDIPFTELGELRANPDVYLQSYLSVRPISIGLNCGRFPFNITKIRQAMNYAIDKQALIDTILGGQGIIQDCPASPDTFGYHASTLFEYNLTKARGLMAEAGYPDGFTQEFVSWANTKYYKNKELHLAIAGYLAQIGIRVRVEVLEQTTLLTKTGETDPMKAGDMFNQAWAPSNADSDWILRPLYYSVPAKYTTSYVKFYNNSRVDELIMEGLTEPNRTARSEIYAEAHEIVFSEAPCIWLYYSKITAGLRSNVHAVQILPVDVYLFREFAYKS